MRIIFSSPSDWIDLEQEGLIQSMLRLSFRFVVTDFLYDQEVKNTFGDYWVSQGLCIEALKHDELVQARKYQKINSKISLLEILSFIIAKNSKSGLLTINPYLHTLAKNENIICYSFSWLIEQMLNEKVISLDLLRQALMAMSKKIRCCLSKKEIHYLLSQVLTHNLKEK
jgi:hypothetical protein